MILSLPVSVVLIAGLLVLMFLGGYAVSVYNNLIAVRNNVEKAFNNIDVLLQQRHDELPKLIESCKAYMVHERAIFEEITRLREHYDRASGSIEKTHAENELNRVMGQLSHRWESYPELKANQSFLQIQQRVSELESSIADRREFFNDSINIYNTSIERFPDLFAARLLSYAKREYLDVPAEKKADAVVRFS